MWWVAVVCGAVVGALILRERYMRSLRVLVLVVGCSIGGSVIFTVVPRWTLGDVDELAVTLIGGAIGMGIVVLPLVICSGMGSYFSALRPTDYREHELIGAVRRLLSQGATSERRAEAIAMLEGAPLAGEDWRPVREALLAQIDQSAKLRPGQQVINEAELLAARRTTIRAWRTALDRRSRFFR